MEQLNAISADATATFMKLISGLIETGAHTTFDEHNYLPERDGGIMSVHVECIGKHRFSVAHYYEQNGDLMSDPNMSFWVSGGKVYPCSYTLHGMGIFKNSILFDEHDMPKSCHNNDQRSLVEFVDMWMDNIKEQQNL